MLSTRLRRFASAHQHRLIPLCIALWAGALSLHFTVRACRGLSPVDSGLEVAALGALGEISKLYFGPRALLGFFGTSRPRAQVGYAALLVLVVILMAGSVGASYVFTTHVEIQAVATVEAAHAQRVAASEKYSALSKEIDTYDVRIEGLMGDARMLRIANKPTKAGEKDAAVGELQAQRAAVALERNALSASVVPSANVGGLAKRWVHLAVALALELVSVAASVLAHAAQPQAGSVKAPQFPAPTRFNGGCAVVPIGAGRNRGPSPSRGAAKHSARNTLKQRCAEARGLIERGLIDPSLEALSRSLRISQRPAQRLLKTLTAEGVLEWTGSRYRLRPVLLTSTAM